MIASHQNRKVQRLKVSSLIREGDKDSINRPDRKIIVDNFLMEYNDRDLQWTFNSSTGWLMLEVKFDKEVMKREADDFLQRAINVITFGEV